MKVQGVHVKDLEELINLKSTDLMYIYDRTLGKSKKVTLNNLRNYLAISDTAPTVPIPNIQSVLTTGSISTTSLKIEIFNDTDITEIGFKNSLSSNTFKTTIGSVLMRTLNNVTSKTTELAITSFTGAVLTDDALLKGLRYAGDYFINGSTNPLWIPHYGAVTTAITNAKQDLQSVLSLGSIYTGTNNLSITSTLNGLSQLQLSGDIVQLQRNGNGLLMTSTSNTFYDVTLNKGLEYATDHSVNFTNESLITKRYTDNKLGSNNISTLLKSPLLAQDGYAVTWDNTAGNYTLTSIGADGNGIYTGSGSLSSPTTVTMSTLNPITFIGGNLTIEGLTDPNLFNTNCSTDSIGIGGLPQTGYKLKTYGSVNIDNNLAIFNNIPVSLTNIKFIDKNLTNNGTTLEVINSATISNGRAVIFNRSGGTGNTLELYASGGSNALSVQGGIISNSNSTGLTYVSTLSAPTGGRFRVGLAGGIFTSAYNAVLRNVGSGQDNIGFNISGSSVSSLNADYIALKGVMVSGTANNIFGTHITLGNQANLGTANTYGHYVNWNGSSSNSVTAISGTHRGFFADMRSPQLSETINGDVYGVDIDMGAGANTVVHNGIHRGANFVFNDSNTTTPFKNIGIEIDMTLSKAITSYGLIVNGSNSGFGTTTPNPVAEVEISSTTKGFLPPRMTAVQASAITAVNGLMLYVTTTDATFTSKGFWGFDTTWKKMTL